MISVPMLMSPSTYRCAPSSSTAVVEISPRSSIDGKKNESSVCVRTLARRFSSFSRSNSSWKARSRLNACTIAIPATDSAMCAVTAAIRLRTSSWATEDVR